MLVIRCTHKTFKKLRIKPRTVEISDSTPTLGDWYVNTIDYLNNGNLMLACMHTESLYVFMAPMDPDMDGPAFAQAFLETLMIRLASLSVPPNIALKILNVYGDAVIFAKSNNRSVAGHLNSALQDLDFLLDNPILRLTKGKHIIVGRVEHRLNDTPRGCSSRKPIWPLHAFWQCLRNLYPELPPQASIDLTPLEQPYLDQTLDILRDHLPLHLTAKIYDVLQSVEVMFSADELQTLIRCFEPQTALASSLPAELVEDLHCQATFRLKRLLSNES